METTKIEKTIKTSVDNTDLTNRFKEAILNIKRYCDIFDWIVTGDLNVTDEFETRIKNASLSCKKKIRNRINMMEYKVSMKKINTLYGYIKRSLHIVNEVRVKPSQRHEEIQAARKEWKAAQAIAEQKLSKYKELKGDYYKKQLAVRM